MLKGNHRHEGIFVKDTKENKKTELLMVLMANSECVSCCLMHLNVLAHYVDEC